VIPPSRALGTKSGDQQARAELLGKLLIAAGEKPLMACHGAGKEAYYLVLVQVTPEEVKELAEKSGKDPTVIRQGSFDLVALPLEPEQRPGAVAANLYDAKTGKWTKSTVITPFK
jgi:hypothetical protein